MKLKWSSITLSDALVLGGFAAVCYGCWLYTPWLPWVVGGVLAIVYARSRAIAVAWSKTRKRDE